MALDDTTPREPLIARVMLDEECVDLALKPCRPLNRSEQFESDRTVRGHVAQAAFGAIAAPDFHKASICGENEINAAHAARSLSGATPAMSSSALALPSSTRINQCSAGMRWRCCQERTV